MPCGSAPTCAVRAETSIALAGVSQKELWKEHLWDQERPLLIRKSRGGDLFTLAPGSTRDHPFLCLAYLAKDLTSLYFSPPVCKKGIMLRTHLVVCLGGFRWCPVKSLAPGSQPLMGLTCTAHRGELRFPSSSFVLPRDGTGDP